MSNTTPSGAATPDTYWDACMRAADNQGLTDMLAKLEELFGDDAGLYQSGGFCMVIQVECPVGFVWVTYDGDWIDDQPDPDSPDGWTVGYYANGNDDDFSNDTDEYTMSNFVNVPEIIASYQRRSAQ